MNEIVRYVIGGVTSSVGEYLSYLLALKVLRFSPYIGVIIGFVVSTLISFGFNEFIVFKKKPGETRNRFYLLIKLISLQHMPQSLFLLLLPHLIISLQSSGPLRRMQIKIYFENKIFKKDQHKIK
nr:GtrA family protein [uncultured Sharpea sp.]